MPRMPSNLAAMKVIPGSLVASANVWCCTFKPATWRWRRRGGRTQQHASQFVHFKLLLASPPPLLAWERGKVATTLVLYFQTSISRDYSVDEEAYSDVNCFNGTLYTASPFRRPEPATWSCPSPAIPVAVYSCYR